MANWYGKSDANFCNYKNAEYDKLYEQLDTEFDEAKRAKIIEQLQQILINDAAVIVHGYYNSSMISDKTVSGANIHTADYYWLTTEIEGFHLKMKPGEICSIVGESGSGKTTVIRSILGLLPSGGKVTKGDILFEGESLLQYSKKQWRELRGTQISMIFQDSGAMINPIRKIGSQYVEYIRAHKNIPKKDAFDMAVEMLEKSVCQMESVLWKVIHLNFLVVCARELGLQWR